MLGRSKHQVTTTVTKTHAFLGKCYIVCCDRNAAKDRAQGRGAAWARSQGASKDERSQQRASVQEML